MNESSAVSDIIQRMNSRRLQTDPADALLFAPATGGAPRARRDQARWFDSSAVEPAPVRAPQSVAPNPRAPNPRAKEPAPRTTPERGRVILLIVATIVAGALGIYGASRIKIGDDAPAASIANVAPVATPPAVEPTPAVEAPLPAPVEHGAETASAPVADTSFTPVANAQPTVAPPVDAIAPTAPTATPTRHRVKHKKVKRLKASTKHSIVQPAAVAPAPKPVAKPSRRAVQSADEESPL
jgi:hypothetical protein